MEETTSEKRGRKRRERSVDESTASETKIRGIGRGKDLVGRYVWKDFPGMGFFLGKVASYGRRLYRVNYEDGDSEDFEYREIRDILMAEEVDSDGQITARKQKLDQLLASTAVGKETEEPVDSAGHSSVISRLSSDAQVDGIKRPDFDEDADSSSDSCEYNRAQTSADSITLQALLLPPSSGNLGVPDDSVPYLFSVYSFLRSFSQQLFLSPFSLDSFVGCLNCLVQNSLLDAIHVSVMRALRRHLDMISSDPSELAIKCLRLLDWNYLDTLTWPVFILEYFLVMGSLKGEFWKLFYDHVLKSDYYTLPAPMKLRALQILCDDVLDSAELRAEIGMRGGSEAEPDVDLVTVIPPENRRKRGRPRKFKPLIYANMGALKVSDFQSDQSEVMVKDVNLMQANNDGNSDECRLCGMDGTLICCDGCPSAYHSRCIGLSKAYLPEGVWFCPECAVRKQGPACSKIGTKLRGAEVFGVDPFEQMFLGTCNYLLVLSTSEEAKSVCKYYNQDDVPTIHQLLSSSELHLSIYAEICKRISEYWEIATEARQSRPEGNEALINASKQHDDDVKMFSHISEMITSSVAFDMKNHPCSISESNVETGGSCQENDYHEAGGSGPSINSVYELDVPVIREQDIINDQTAKQIYQVRSTDFQQQPHQESVVSTGTGALLPVSAAINCHSSEGRFSIMEHAGVEDAESAVPKVENTEGCQVAGASFKPYSYINLYVLGDVAASAAANLAILTAENGRVAETFAMSNTGKITSENVSLQVKAFSEASMPFLWPSAERKLAEIPRERCGWCLACKAPPSRKMGCLLNAAASNSLKGAVRVVGTFRHVRNVECPLSAIAAYIMHMEECLRGLMVGSLSDGNYRLQWRKQVELASSCKILKHLLLELEENIHALGLSVLWAKLVDDWSAERSAAQTGSSASGMPQKRGPSTRRSKKQSVGSDVTLDPCPDWWRGGRLSKMLFLKGMLPSSDVKKAARQGGFKKIRGLSYIDEIPRRSRRIAWKAAVEFSLNSSQLALHVRCLDAHIRWSELVHLEQNFLEGKGLDIESSSAFRNAFISDKKVVERQTRYGLTFSNQKYLPSRLMKNVLEVETTEDGRQKLWLPDTCIPLYLIKEYEENGGQHFLTCKSTQANLPEFLVKQLKHNDVENIYTYLMSREEKPQKIPCVSCQKSVLIRSAIKCSKCEGYSHKECLTPSISDMKNDRFIPVCSMCYHIDAVSPKEQQAKRQLKIKISSQGSRVQPTSLPPSIVRVESQVKHAPVHGQKATSKNRSGAYEIYGLIWRRNKPKTKDGGLNFRLHNILHRGRTDLDHLSGPICSLCQQPYNPDLMYIRCMTCPNWFHADAVELQEDEIDDLEGLRCGKCRRKASPICPFMSPAAKEKKLQRAKIKRQGNAEMARKTDSAVSSQRTENNMDGSPEMTEWGTPQFYQNAEDLMLTVPDEKIEPIVETNAAEHAGDWLDEWPLFETPKKLPVRRHIKQEVSDTSGFATADPDNLTNEKTSLPLAEWDMPNGSNFVEHEGGHIESSNFEPQTFFSFTELMALGDADLTDSLMALGLLEDAGNSVVGGGNDAGPVTHSLTPYSQFQHPGTGANKSKQVLNSVPCQRCEQSEPVPDLLCMVCNIRIHGHCSPWVEDPCDDLEGWRCGKCRDWR